jgi:hypothetical protein
VLGHDYVVTSLVRIFRLREQKKRCPTNTPQLVNFAQHTPDLKGPTSKETTTQGPSVPTLPPSRNSESGSTPADPHAPLLKPPHKSLQTHPTITTPPVNLENGKKRGKSRTTRDIESDSKDNLKKKIPPEPPLKHFTCITTNVQQLTKKNGSLSLHTHRLTLPQQ